jgi:Predicted pyridoxal phosphate-dependent enzyme apparently involved in regulation of cell wall biogenesis
MQWKVQLFQLNYDQREYDAVEETLRSGWITMGPKTQASNPHTRRN